MDPADWYAMVNARVFFWLDPERLNRQRAACEPRPQVVMVVDTAALVASYEEQVSVTRSILETHVANPRVAGLPRLSR
jgi:hypothetical protein